MAVVTTVPLNTMLADLDESLRAMLKRELGKHGFDGVDIVFDAPTKEWAAGLSSPTVNLFLYDLRESVERRVNEWTEQRGNGQSFDQRPPLQQVGGTIRNGFPEKPNLPMSKLHACNGGIWNGRVRGGVQYMT